MVLVEMFDWQLAAICLVSILFGLVIRMGLIYGIGRLSASAISLIFFLVVIKEIANITDHLGYLIVALSTFSITVFYLSGMVVYKRGFAPIEDKLNPFTIACRIIALISLIIQGSIYVIIWSIIYLAVGIFAFLESGDNPFRFVKIGLTSRIIPPFEVRFLIPPVLFLSIMSYWMHPVVFQMSIGISLACIIDRFLRNGFRNGPIHAAG
jgi:hypothetical protein